MLITRKLMGGGTDLTITVMANVLKVLDPLRWVASKALPFFQIPVISSLLSFFHLLDTPSPLFTTQTSALALECVPPPNIRPTLLLSS